MNILIIDDTPEILLVLTRILEDDGHLVTTAIDGYDGICKLSRNRKFDLIITDLHMPMLNGYKLAHESRKLTNAPVFLHTGDSLAKITPDIKAIIPKGDLQILRSEMEKLNKEWPIDRSCDD